MKLKKKSSVDYLKTNLDEQKFWNFWAPWLIVKSTIFSKVVFVQNWFWDLKNDKDFFKDFFKFNFCISQKTPVL